MFPPLTSVILRNCVQTTLMSDDDGTRAVANAEPDPSCCHQMSGAAISGSFWRAAGMNYIKYVNA